MIAMLVWGLVVFVSAALVLAIVDRLLESRWREIAAERRERWLARQGGYRGEPWDRGR